MSHDQVGMDIARHAGERANAAMMDAISLCETPQQVNMVAFQVLGIIAASSAGILSKNLSIKIDGKDTVAILEMLTEIMRDARDTRIQRSTRARKGGEDE